MDERLQRIVDAINAEIAVHVKVCQGTNNTDTYRWHEGTIRGLERAKAIIAAAD